MTKHNKGLPIIGRRKALQCLAWSGAGVAWVLNGGVARGFSLGSTAFAAEVQRGDFVFAQISDSHIGFNKEANPDTAGTLQQALAQVKSINPAFVLHTGDVTHLSKPEEFDTAAQLIGASRLEVHYVPGEHDVLNENANLFFERFVPMTKKGWYSFDSHGVHFIALVNVMDFKAGGVGHIGEEQLRWLEQDLRDRSASTPMVVFTHIPLWNVYSDWGWATDDAEAAMGLLRRFGSVTVLNGHIHQAIQKVEGHIVFHTAMSTAYPQPAPGQAAGPGPLKVPAEQLSSVLGTRSVSVANAHFAITDSTLASGTAKAPDSFLNSIFAGG